MSPEKALKKERERKILAKQRVESIAKPNINLVVCGHVDAGKSTLMGHLLYKLGVVTEREMHKNKKEANAQGKGSFAYAYLLDLHEEERSRGVTVDVCLRHFETKDRRITLLDSPGHKDFVPNMIAGAAQAEHAILVVNASRNEFEAGFADNGQTKEHAILIQSLGVKQVILAVNKMDTCNWSKERYDYIVGEMDRFLKKIGLKK